ncbi:rCG29324 [Rattus norvegicus]|uniref:RCG29324 n=1 Tax=Rattus norvegicus TaxID=10116 RepID=A6K961_RAT|nr:rCG29324 [Rattus norvegicus]
MENIPMLPHHHHNMKRCKVFRPNTHAPSKFQCHYFQK